MGTAYVLINCDLGSQKSILNELKLMESIDAAKETFGSYGIIAKVTTNEEETLRHVISNQIRKINKVSLTKTLIIVEDNDQIKLDDLIPDVIPEEKKPLEPPTEIEEEDDFDEEDDK